MERLLNIGLWAGVVFLMMKLGCGKHIVGHARGDRLHPASNKGADDASILASESAPS